MQGISYTSKSFKITSVGSYQLKIFYSPIGFIVWSVFNDQGDLLFLSEQKFLSSAEVHLSVKQIYQANLWLKDLEVSMLYVLNDQFTLIPEALFDSNKAREILSFNVHVSDAQSVLNDQLNTDIQNIYVCEKLVCDEIKKYHQDISITHFLSKLIISDKVTKEDTCVYLLRDLFVYLSYQKGVLKQCEIYSADNIKDQTYFILKNREGEPLGGKIRIWGNASQSRALAESLKHYVHHDLIKIESTGSKYPKEASELSLYFGLV